MSMTTRGTVFIGNTNHIPVKEDQPETFSILITSCSIGNNKSMWSCMNLDGPTVVKIKSIKLINVATASIAGVNAEFQFNRITSHVSGTDILAFPFDTQDTIISGITFKTGATVSGSTGPLLRYFWSSDEYTQSAGDVNHADHTMMNIIPTYIAPAGTKPLTIRQNEGFSLDQKTNSNQGLFDIEIIFTQE